MSIKAEKYMADVANFAEDLVNEAELESVQLDSYLIRVPKYEWQDLVEAVKEYALKENRAEDLVDAVFYGENFNRAEGDQ